MTTKRDALRGEFYCHECDGWTETRVDEDGFRTCVMCWELIKCDECGADWTDDHECAERMADDDVGFDRPDRSVDRPLTVPEAEAMFAATDEARTNREWKEG